MDEFLTSWAFIGLMALLLVVMTVVLPIFAILFAVYAAKKQREAKRGVIDQREDNAK